MRRFGSKGQGAMEYLMTYGWAILVVMIVGVVLWQLNIFGGNQSANAVGFSKIKPLNPGQLQMSAVNGFSGVFMNGAGGTASLTNANMVFTAPAAIDCNTQGVQGQVGTPGSTFPGDYTTLEDVGAAIGAQLAIGQGDTFDFRMLDCSGATLTAGQRYSATVTLVYTIDVGGFSESRTEAGTVSGPVIA